MPFHRDLTLDDVHSLAARVYTDLAARDAAADFHSVENINKIVRVDSPLGYYVLVSISPPVWVEVSNAGNDTFLELLDSPSSFAGEAGKVVQTNAAESALEFGQRLRTTDSPLFKDLTLTGDLTIQGDVATLDTVTLLVEDKNIELGNVATPTDATADGGGITLLAGVDGDKTIKWLNATNRWTFNQGIDLQGNILVSTGIIAPDILIAAIQAFAGNLLLSGNILSSTNANGNIILDPNGTGKVVVNNISLTGNTIATLSGDLDLTSGTGGVFKFTVNAIRAGLDAVEYVEMGHGGGKGFINKVGDGDLDIRFEGVTKAAFTDNSIRVGLDAVNLLEIGHGGANAFIIAFGAGGLDFRFEGTTKATFTDAGHLHLLTDLDQRDILKLKTVNNLNDTGMAWEDAFGLFTHAIFRTDTGNNRAGLVFAAGQDANVNLLTNSFIVHGGVGTEGKLEVLGTLQISNAGGALDRVLTSDANGIATWQTLPAGLGGWIDDGTVVRLATAGDNVGIGTASPGAKLEVAGQIKITGGNPGNSRYLRSNPDGLATWGDIGWAQLGTDVVLLDSSNKVGIGTPIPAASAKLEVASTTKGFLSPRMTETQRDAISSPATGLKIYNTTVNKYEIFTGTVWKTFLTEDVGTVVAQETFASTNVRFFGELALPTAQGWIDTATGSATIDLFADTVFGESKQVVRHNDDVTNGSTTSLIVLTLQNWTDIRDFGASFSGISRLDAVNGAAGFFVGLQADAADNPLATGNRRYGLTFANVLGNLKITEPSGTTITFDGTGGSPLVASDEWFSWECVVPAGLGAAEFYINRILTTFAPTFITNAGGLGTSIRVSSGSTSGTNRVTYHDNFGVTIFEETATKTLLATTMAGDVAQINIPEGKRDYTIILPDGNPRAIGTTLRLVANNVLGLISLENQNPAAPEILYNGLRTLVIDVFFKEIIGGINTVDQGNVYIGFKDEDIDRVGSIFAQLSSSVDQTPTDTNPTVITYNTQDEINGIGHSTSLNPGELEILPGAAGVYFVSPQAQVGLTSGSLTTFDMFWQIDRGSGFVDEPNSNIKLTLDTADITDVIVSAFTIKLDVGDKIRMMQRVSNAAVGMGLKNTDAEVGPPTVPRTPAIILAMFRVGGVPA